MDFTLESAQQAVPLRSDSTTIRNEYYTLSFTDGELKLTDNRTGQSFVNPVHFDDGGDEGDTYDYSPVYQDWLINLTLEEAEVTGHQGKLVQ